MLVDALLLYENTQEMLLHKEKRIIYVSLEAESLGFISYICLMRAWWRATYVGSIHDHTVKQDAREQLRGRSCS